MDEYFFWFETDYGYEQGVVEALSIVEAKKMVAANHPNDIGSDGYLEDQDGNESYLWSEHDADR